MCGFYFSFMCLANAALSELQTFYQQPMWFFFPWIKTTTNAMTYLVNCECFFLLTFFVVILFYLMTITYFMFTYCATAFLKSSSPLVQYRKNVFPKNSVFLFPPPNWLYKSECAGLIISKLSYDNTYTFYEVAASHKLIQPNLFLPRDIGVRGRILILFSFMTIICFCTIHFIQINKNQPTHAEILIRSS